ncbi:MAG: coenzyme F420 hydrogenase [Methanomassiliicoccales archaeon]|nr:coenzyme F420 hydrogenase [Methanomassiliicoccales archaeon]
MTPSIRINEAPEAAVIDVLTTLLSEGRVAAVITLQKGSDGISYSLISDTAELEKAVPMYPLMPSNLGQILGRLTIAEAFRETVAVVARPCELRGFIELVKRQQGRLDNMLIISHICGGVYPLECEVKGDIEALLPEYWKSFELGNAHPRLRPACRSCVEFVPYTADIAVNSTGGGDSTAMMLNTPWSQEMLEGLYPEGTDEELDVNMISSIRESREGEKAKIFAEHARPGGLGGLVEVFGRCIGCHACSKACPICYCTLCNFESSVSELSPEDYEREIEKRGGMRVPPDTVYFHLGRMSHIGISCVACGSCQDVCPVDIPISILFKKVSESVQDMFDYVPGRDPGEKLPVCTFEVDEFREVED